jgi:hypothetical protein
MEPARSGGPCLHCINRVPIRGRRSQDLPIVANIVTVAAPITAALVQASRSTQPVTANFFISRVFCARSGITTIIGAAATPLMTALQKSALNGSIGVRFSRVPIAIDASSTP